MTKRRFELRGRQLYAIDASMLEMLFGYQVTPNVDTPDGSTTIVTVNGALSAKDGEGCDSYEAISQRFDEALAANTRAVVLRICSPGGDATGAPELARAMRARADAAGKPVYAYGDERACSAAYAIACAADSITVAPTAFVGSVGIITTRVDLTAQNAERGVRVQVFSSGKRKADGHPDTPLEDDEAKATQTQIDRFADIYFDLVGSRRGLTVDKVRALEAGVYQGNDAVGVGLADNTETYDAFLARISSGETAMAMTAEEMRDALAEMAESEGEYAARAKRALAAFDMEDDEEKAEAEDESTEDKAEDEPADDDKPKDEEKKTDAKAAATSESDIAALRADLEAWKASVRRERLDAEAQERTTLLASRPDITGQLRKELADPKLPITKLRALVKATPKGRIPVTGKQALAATTAKPTQGDRTTELDGPHLPAAQKAQMDEIMGLTSYKTGVVNTPTRQILGARLPATPERSKH